MCGVGDARDDACEAKTKPDENDNQRLAGQKKSGIRSEARFHPNITHETENDAGDPAKVRTPQKASIGREVWPIAETGDVESVLCEVGYDRQNEYEPGQAKAPAASFDHAAEVEHGE